MTDKERRPVINTSIQENQLEAEWTAITCVATSRYADEAAEKAIEKMAMRREIGNANVIHCCNVQVITDMGYYTAVATGTPAKAKESFLRSLDAAERAP